MYNNNLHAPQKKTHKKTQKTHTKHSDLAKHNLCN